MLEIDHVNPVSRGGRDDFDNLVTACSACNNGKSNALLRECAPRPDNDIKYLKVQQEIVEQRRFLEATEERAVLNEKICTVLRERWEQLLTAYCPANRILLPWVDRYGPEEVEAAILSVASRYAMGRFGADNEAALHALINYIGATLRNRRDEAFDK